MRLFRKALGLFLSLLLAASVFIMPVSAYAEESDKLIKGTFTMETFDGYDPGELDYYFSDDYFSGSGSTINPHLRTMSAALVFTAQGTSDVPEETFGTILRNIGFSDLETYDMDHTAMDSMGVVLARKTIGEKDVIAVVLRGDQYEVEMAANLIAGAEGDIRAFADAEALVESRVSAYLDKYSISQAKYWVVGYSRSGAVANLFGRALNRDLTGFCTTGDDIYVYAFEAALGSADNPAYDNIHNIIDLRDTITYVYPALWSMYGCGVPDYIGNTDETITLKSFSFLSETHSEDIGEIKTVDFINDFVDYIANSISRETYYDQLQTPASQVAEIYFSLSKEESLVFIEYFREVFSELMNDDNLITILLGALLDPYSENSAQSVVNLITKYMDQVSETYGKPVSDEDYNTIKAALLPVVSVLLPIAYQDLMSTYTLGDSQYPTSAPLYHILTFVGNLNTLFMHHYNYNVFNELTALDSYYQKRAEIILGDADGDGEVSILDATYIQRKMANIPTKGFVEEAADADENGDVEVPDATMIQRWLAHFAANENIGKPIAY